MRISTYTVQNFNATLTYLHKYQIQLVLLWVLLMYSGVIRNIVGFVPVDNATSDGFAAIQVLLLLPIMVIAAMSSEGYDDDDHDMFGFWTFNVAGWETVVASSVVPTLS